MKKALSYVVILLVLIFGFVLLTRQSPFVAPYTKDYPIHGIDVSHHQGTIDWSLVSKDNIQFVYIKATEADDLKDSEFKFNWEESRQNGLQVGAYHFYSLAYDGKAQAENFIGTVPNVSDQLQPVIDLEYVGNSVQRPSPGEFNKNLKEYIEIVSNYYGQQPILYTTYKFYRDYLDTEFADYDIWIRDIYSYPNTDKIGAWKIWQYSSLGKIDGIKGFVDLNVFSQKSPLQI